MKNIITILFTLLCISLFGQKTVESIKLGNVDEIIHQSALPSKGFVLVTGKDKITGGKHDLDVHYFDQTGKQVWSRNIPGKYIYASTTTSLVISPNEEHIYFIQMQEDGYFSKKHYISQFNLNGDEIKFELEGREEFGKSLQTIFCDNDFLYYLATDEGKESSSKKKVSEKLILNRFAYQDLAYKRFILELPTIEGGDHSIYWSLIGQNTNEKFLASKVIDTDKGSNKFMVAPFNSNGSIGKILSFETILEGFKFTRPSYFKVENYWENQIINFDSFWQPIGSSGGSRLIQTDGAFGQIQYSNLHNSFYIFGLFGSKPFRNMGSVYEGFYVHRYGRDGIVSWKIQEMANNQLIENKAFRVQGTAMERDFTSAPIHDNKLIATIKIGKSIFTNSIESSGTSKPQSNYEIKNNWRVTYLGGNTTKSPAYINKVDAGMSVSYLSYVYPTHELLLRFDSKKSILEVINLNN